MVSAGFIVFKGLRKVVRLLRLMRYRCIRFKAMLD